MAKRTVTLTLDVTVSDEGTDALDVAEAVFDYLADSLPGEIPGVFSFDGCDVVMKRG